MRWVFFITIHSHTDSITQDTLRQRFGKALQWYTSLVTAAAQKVLEFVGDHRDCQPQQGKLFDEVISLLDVNSLINRNVGGWRRLWGGGTCSVVVSPVVAELNGLRHMGNIFDPRRIFPVSTVISSSHTFVS